MSPRKKKMEDQAATQPVFVVSVESLARLLDLPAGTDVAGVEVDADTGHLLLTLTGVDWANNEGWRPPRRTKVPERVTADYSVDSRGRRSFNFFAPADEAADDQTPPPEGDDAANPEEKE